MTCDLVSDLEVGDLWVLFCILRDREIWSLDVQCVILADIIDRYNSEEGTIEAYG